MDDTTDLSPTLHQQLRSVATAASAAEDLERFVLEVADRIIEGLAVDVVTFLVLDHDSDELVVRASRGLEAEVHAGVRIPVGLGVAGRTVSEQRTQILSDLGEAQVWSPNLREELASLISVPLVSGSTVIGVLNVGSRTPRAFSGTDVTATELFAQRVAQAMDRLLLRGADSRGTDVALDATRLLDQLRILPEELATAVTVAEVSEIALTRVQALTGAERANIVLVGDGRVEVHRQHGYQRSNDRTWSDDLLEHSGPLGDSLRTGEVAAVTGRARILERYPELEGLLEPPTSTLLSVPLLSAGGVVGAIGVSFDTEREFGGDLLRILHAVGIQVGAALDRAHLYDREHATADHLRALVRARPAIAASGVEVGVGHRPHDDIGGDWHLVEPLPDGSMAVILGDVVGHGLAAAAAVSQLRIAARALVGAGVPLASLPEHLHRLLDDLPDGARYGTVVAARLDADRTTLRVVCVGHPAPILVRRGRPHPLDVVPLPPLSEHLPGWTADATLCRVEPGDTLAFYTDGLIERRDATLDDGLDRLIDLLGRRDTDPAADVATEAVDLAGGHDDATIVLVRILGD